MSEKNSTNGKEDGRKKWGVYEDGIFGKVAVCYVDEAPLHDLYSEKCACNPKVLEQGVISHRKMTDE